MKHAAFPDAMPRPVVRVSSMDCISQPLRPTRVPLGAAIRTPSAPAVELPTDRGPGVRHLLVARLPCREVPTPAEFTVCKEGH